LPILEIVGTSREGRDRFSVADFARTHRLLTVATVWVGIQLSSPKGLGLSRGLQFGIVHYNGELVEHRRDVMAEFAGRRIRGGRFRDAVVGRGASLVVLDVDEYYLGVRLGRILAAGGGPSVLVVARAWSESNRNFLEQVYERLLGGEALDVLARVYQTAGSGLDVTLITGSVHQASGEQGAAGSALQAPLDPSQLNWVPSEWPAPAATDPASPETEPTEGHDHPNIGDLPSSVSFEADNEVSGLNTQGEITTEYRLLNANFALDRPLQQDEALVSGVQYDFLVQIGSPWQPGESIVSRGGFPEVLPDDPPGNILDAVLVSDQFTPRLVTGRLLVPPRGTSRSLAESVSAVPGALALKVTTPVLEPGVVLQPAHARLFIYYENNLVQSAAVEAWVATNHSRLVGVRNSIVVDFRLTQRIASVEERFAQRGGDTVDALDGPAGLGVRLVIAHNANGPDHRIVVHDGNEPPLNEAVTYDPGDAAMALQQARAILSDCFYDRNGGMPIRDDQHLAGASKNRVGFESDVEQLARFGFGLKSRLLQMLGPTGSGGSPATLMAELRTRLNDPALIQIAHVGSQYAFPWALVYDYPLSAGKTARRCPSFDEWDGNGRRANRYMVCPTAGEDWHRSDVICPFGFWGLKHVIEETLSYSDVPPPKLQLGSRLDTSIALATGPAFDVLTRPHLDNLAKFTGFMMKPDEPAETEDAVWQMLKQPGFVYFLCHSREVDGQGQLLVGGGDGPPGLRDSDISYLVQSDRIDNGWWTTLPTSFRAESLASQADSWQLRRAPLSGPRRASLCPLPFSLQSFLFKLSCDPTPPSDTRCAMLDGA
jgi:hypothetical protein